MKDIQLEQGSQEWLNFRKKHIGCSEVGVILGLNPYKSAYMLWLEKCGFIEPEEKNEAMFRGIALEPRARDKYIEITNNPVVPKILVYKKWDILMASLDGISFDEKFILEVKCPSNRRLYDQAKEDKFIPEYYFAQMQFQLLISEAESCDYMVYLNDKEYEIIHVFPDYKYIEDNFYKLKEFWNMIETKVPPKKMSGDPLFISNIDINNLANEYKELKLKIKELETQLDIKEMELKEFVKDEDRVIFGNSGVKATAYIPKGTIDWKKISLDYDISDEIQNNYRKESNKIIRFTI